MSQVSAAWVFASAALFWNCSGSRPVQQQNPSVQPQAGQPGAAKAERKMRSAESGLLSPGGDRHPGEIVNEDRITGRTWTEKVSEVPQGIAWVSLHGKWVPVVRITMTGTAAHMEITAYGPDGAWLQSTVSAPQPAASARPAPVPVPIPSPTK